MNIACLLLAIVATGALAAADLSGRWIGTISMGRTLHCSLLLHQKEQGRELISFRLPSAPPVASLGQRGPSIEGFISFDPEAQLYPITNGELHQNELTFETAYAYHLYRFCLKVAGGRLEGYANGSLKVVLKGPLVTFPVVLREVQPAYTEEGRRLKREGSVVLVVQVDSAGKPEVKRVLQPLGNGLDEQAVEAVQKWRFRPAYDRGKPITMDTMVEIEFRLH